MIRFLFGLGLGAGSAAVTWLFTHSPTWTAVIGGAVFVLVWVGELIVDDLL